MSGPAIEAGSRDAAGTGRARRAPAAQLADGVRGFTRGLVLTGLVVAALVPMLALAMCAMIAITLVQWLIGQDTQGGPDSGLIVGLILTSLLYVRSLAALTRRLCGSWFSVSIPAPYLPAPDYSGRPLRCQLRDRLLWLATDPASWRDMLWLPVSVLVGAVFVLAPLAMALYGLVFTVLPLFGVPVENIPYLGVLTARSLPAGLSGIAVSLAGLWLTPRLLPGYAVAARALLGPTRRAELATRVRQLARTRAEYIDAGAAELRRIERDLHDGAQARLVAMGMTLDAVAQQLDTNPEAARALLAEARASSVNALAELRDLVRGVHPPVLADRGLADAIRALVLDSPLSVRVSAELAGRPPAPVESAAYFAVSELLANVSKHAAAREAWIDVRHADGLLRISVGDDGHGGADPGAGTGLRGIDRRLAAFDGVLAVSSPAGGPTVANLEIPCALSSLKTFSC